MNIRISVLLTPLFLLPASSLIAQHSPDPTKARLEAVAYMAGLTRIDLDLFSSQAQSGDREAQFWLASIYEEGKLVQRDHEQAERWFLKSAQEGYPPAERTLGLFYWFSDRAQAAMWLQRAAQRGDSEAQFWLGIAY